VAKFKEFDIDRVVESIASEARRRLETDACCPGGLRAKIHGVWMEVGLKIGEEMRKSIENAEG